MTIEKIEKILRNAPKPRAPGDLLTRLRADIRRSHRSRSIASRASAVPWFKRWFPAFATAMILVCCAGVLVAQTSTLSRLRSANRALLERVAKLSSSPNDSAEIQRLVAENKELDRLRRDKDEVQQLREEIAELQTLLPVIARIRIENRDLAARLARRRDSESSEEFFARVPGIEEAREKARRTKCVSNLKNLGLAARIWATDHGDVVPSSFLEMKLEMATPKLLVCPSDTARTSVEDWSQFSPGQSSYEFLSPGAADFDPQVVLFRCPIHNNVTLADGSVQQLGHEVRVSPTDGKWKIAR